MKRFTERTEDGSAEVHIADYGAPPYSVVTRDFVEKLASYEDTGLTPEEIEHLKALEVVRCKDCTEYNGHRYCNYHADPVDDDDFCSYGERKE